MKLWHILEKKFLAAVKEFALLSPLDKVLLSVSGGPDSMSLLDLFFYFKARWGLNLLVASLDHGLRPESEKEFLLVKGQCEKFLIPFYGEKIAPREFAGAKMISIEEAGSRLRREYLLSIKNRYSVDKIATGHTLDDQAETILLHIIRGSSPAGLSGIWFSAPEGFIRPLLKATRKEVLDYCNFKNIPYALDTSNLDIAIPRNRIRAELLPTLTSYNPRIRESLGRLAVQAQREVNFLNRLAEEKFSVLAECSENRVVFPHAGLRELSPVLRNLLFRLAVKRLRGDLKDLSQVHLDNLNSLLGGLSGNFIPLPGGLRAVKDQRFLTLLFPVLKEELPPVELGLPGSWELPEWGLKLSCELLEIKELSSLVPADGWQAFLAEEKLGDKVLIRSRREGGEGEGDRFKPPGKIPSKRLKKFLQELKIPRAKRDQVPVMESLKEGEIAWLVGYKVSRSFLPDSETKRIYHFKAEMLDQGEEGAGCIMI